MSGTAREQILIMMAHAGLREPEISQLLAALTQPLTKSAPAPCARSDEREAGQTPAARPASTAKEK